MLNAPRILRIRHIPVHVHWSAFLIIALITINIGGVAGVFVGFIAGFAFLASVLLHELAHALTARRFGIETDRITLWGLGGIASFNTEAPSARADGWTAAAGPIMSAAIAGIGMGGASILHAYDIHGVAVGILFWLGLTNAVLAGFNLLPGAPLDGGRILAAWRWSRHGDRYRAREEAARAGVVVGAVVAGAGAFLAMRGVGGLMLPLTGVFIAVNAATERHGAAAARRLAGIRVGDLTWYGIARADSHTTVNTMLWERSRLGGAGVVAVQDGVGNLVGVVPEERMLRVPEERREFVTLGQLVIPVEHLARSRSDESLVYALGRVNPIAPVLTVWHENRLVGVVPVARLRERIAPAFRN